MLKKICKALLVVFSVIVLGYLLLPNPPFPNPPPGSLQSDEPGDTETPLRRAYFTDLTREEVINYYKNEFNKGFGVYTPRLNYPPEESGTIIRDQTRSTFLEEIVHPFRESLFINGFEPKDPKDAVIIKGTHFRQKIIVRYVPSSPLVRVPVFVLTIVSLTVLIGLWKEAFKGIRKIKIKI